MKYVKPHEMVAGEMYRLVDVKRHPFGMNELPDAPFRFDGRDSVTNTVYFKRGAAWVRQVFSDCWVELGDFKIIKAEQQLELPLEASPEEPTRKVTPVGSLTPQCRTILKHLKKGHTITQRSALIDFGIAALPRRIADLKEAGYDIESVMEHNKLTGQRYVRYSLIKN